MAKKKTEGKISFKDIKGALNVTRAEAVEINLGTEEAPAVIKVKKDISFKEYGKFVSSVADMVFVEGDKGEVVYCPYVKEFAIRYHEIECFTNIDMPAAMADVEMLIKDDSLFEKIDEVIGEERLAQATIFIDEMIQAKLAAKNSASKFDKIITLFEDMLDNVSSKLEGMDAKDILDYFSDVAPSMLDGNDVVAKEQSVVKTAE